MSENPQIIGVTGGIGSGKSTVCRIFQHLGYSVYSADDRAKAVMVSYKPLVKQLKELFGEEAYFPDGSLNRKWIGAQVFSNKEKLQALNSLVHPAVHRDFHQWVEKLKLSYHKSFVLYEAAILFESGGKDRVNGVITVFAPKTLRIQRVVSRDRVSPEQVEARMNNQWPDHKKLALADFVIYNDEKHMLIPQVFEAVRFWQERKQTNNS